MTKLIFVHGINNQDNTASQIAKKWRNWLEAGLRKRGKSLPANTVVTVPYYGKMLAGEADDWEKTLRDLRIDEISTSSDSIRMLEGKSAAIEFLRQYQDLAEISDAELDASLNLLQIGDGIDQRQLVVDTLFKELVAALAALLPDAYKDFARAFFSQGGAYMQKEGLPDRIEKYVVDQIDEIGPDSIVFGHSLGSVVMYRYMRNLPAEKQPKLFLSLGSPLGIKPFQQALGGTMKCLSGGTRWLNIADRSDFVALEETLDGSTFGCDQIDNETVQNWFDAHSIKKYLRQKKTADAIIDALSL